MDFFFTSVRFLKKLYSVQTEFGSIRSGLKNAVQFKYYSYLPLMY